MYPTTTTTRFAPVVLGLVLASLAACSDDDVMCPDGQTLCGTRCVNLQNDPISCGSCAESCGEGEVCSLGSCSTSCPVGFEDCSGSCRDVMTDRSNCGGCGTTCDAGEICVDGQCADNCPAGQIACGDQCVATDSDRANCGGCGNACGTSELCADGSCDLVCPPGQADCSGSCRDTNADRANCGGCGVACGIEEVCVDGTCTLSCAGGAPDECNGACTNIATDPRNCGLCGQACGTNDVCDQGTCRSECGEGLARCGQTCTSTLTDPSNCGACENACPTASGATPVCVEGGCGLACRAGFDDCDDDLVLSPSNGCEIDLSSDANNCGACGQACVFANGAGACQNSGCIISGCDPGFGDCNAMGTDGCEAEFDIDSANCGACGIVCGMGESCVMAACEATPGENCFTAIPLVAGSDLYSWTAMTSDYLTANPSCVSSSFLLTGPDVVFVYSSVIDGFVTIELTKPSSQRFVFIVSDQPCGIADPAAEIECASEFTGTTMSASFRVAMGQDYYVYFNDTTSGSQALPNPLDLEVTELNCAGQAASVTQLSPTSGSTTSDLRPTFEITFDAAVNTTTGTVTITGDMGTALAYDLSTNPSQVGFNAPDTIMTIDPDLQFLPGERLTISWIGLEDVQCGNPIPAPTYEVSVIVPPCIPGQGGMIGSTVSRLATSITVSTEYYVAADTSTAGFVYVGGLTDLQRIPKSGGTVEDIDTLASLTGSNLGYEMLIDGTDIYTINESSSGTSGRIYRISSDGGATWNVFDAVSFPTAPADEFRAAEVYRGRIYLMTLEGTSSVDTEVWSFPAGTTTATVAQIEGTFDEGDCSGLAVDDQFFYAACSDGERLVRVGRSTGVVELISTNFDISSTNNSMYGVDTDLDGTLDFIYFQTWYEEGYFVCDPGSMAPFVGNLFDFGGANSSYGMGYDGMSRLFAFDDDSDELIIVE